MEQRLQRDEQETHLWFNREEGIWHCYTNIRSDMTKLDKKQWEVVEEDYYEDGKTIRSKTYIAPKNSITFRNPTKKRQLSEKERQRLGEQLRGDKDEN